MQRNIFFSLPGEFHRELDFLLIDENTEIKKFKKDYEDYFEFNGDEITLRTDISLREFSNFIFETYRGLEIDQALYDFDFFYSDSKDDVIKLLNIHTIENIEKEYLKFEKKLEQLYNKLYTVEDNEDLRKEIKHLLAIRYMFLKKIREFSQKKLAAFQSIATEIHESFFDEHKDEAVKEIDAQACIESKYFEDSSLFAAQEKAELGLYDGYQLAIFSRIDLYTQKLSTDIEEIAMEDPFGYKDMDSQSESDDFDFGDDSLELLNDFEEEFELNDNEYLLNYNVEEEQLILYLRFIKRINVYMENFGVQEELLNTKRRLLYALDSPELRLYEEENFEQIYEESLDVAPEVIDEDSLWFLSGLIYYLCDEVFQKPENDFTVIKLLEIGAFYEVLLDDNIIEILNKYKSHPKYNEYMDIIFNKNIGRTRKKS